MPIEDLVKQVAGTIERDGSVKAVFGPAMKLEHHVIVPVAVVTGGAAGGGSQPGADSTFAGGVGVGLNVRPVGFIFESGDQVLFTPIQVDERRRSPWTEVARGAGRVLELAYSALMRSLESASSLRRRWPLAGLTQFMQGIPPRAPPQSRSSTDPAPVGSPS